LTCWCPVHFANWAFLNGTFSSRGPSLRFKSCLKKLVIRTSQASLTLSSTRQGKSLAVETTRPMCVHSWLQWGCIMTLSEKTQRVKKLTIINEELKLLGSLGSLLRIEPVQVNYFTL
jgi:hypothetical protein